MKNEKKFRILHAPVNSAGWTTAVSRAQRKLGYKSDVLIFYQNYINYECDIILNLDQKPLVMRPILRLVYFIKCFFAYDVFHFHFGQSLLHFNLDLPILKFFRKKVVMHYWGSDVIQTDLARQYTLFTEEVFQKVYPEVDNEKRRKKLAWIARHVGCAIVGDYSLLPYAPQSKVVRQTINLDNLPFVGCDFKNHQKLRIIHAPSKRLIKGTKYILETIQQLKKAGYKFEFVLVEKKSNQEALAIYKTADIVIDEIMQGPYGILAIECMALGKPVICRRDEKLEKYYKNLPIINANRTNLQESLIKLIENPKLRQRLGVLGRKYVEENHDPINIAKQMIKIYKSL